MKFIIFLILMCFIVCLYTGETYIQYPDKPYIRIDRPYIALGTVLIYAGAYCFLYHYAKGGK